MGYKRLTTAAILYLVYVLNMKQAYQGNKPYLGKVFSKPSFERYRQ